MHLWGDWNPPDIWIWEIIYIPLNLNYVDGFFHLTVVWKADALKPLPFQNFAPNL